MSKETKILGAIVVVVIVAALIGANYYRSSTQPQPAATGDGTDVPRASNEFLIRPDSPSLGAADAKVTIVEFLDPECEACAAFSPAVKQILKDFDGKVRLVVRYMPLHPNSLLAATFTEAAGEQGKYWEAHEILFTKQSEWGTVHGHGAEAPKADVNALFKKYAAELGLDMAKMDAAIAENKFAAKIDRDKKDGESLGVQRTPTLFVNGRELALLSDQGLRFLIEDELKR